MNVKRNRFPVLLLLSLLLIGFGAQTSSAAWITLLNEHFNQDPQNQAAEWPWCTPLQNPAIRWHYNPWNPYPRAEGRIRSQYCWGYQSAFFNVRVLQEEDFPGSLWCAYTNGSDTRNPRWPRDVDYMPGQNAWVWWDTLQTHGLRNGGVSFWMMIDLATFSFDSLSAFIVTDPNDLTDPNIRAHGKFGAMRNNEGEFAGITSFSTATQWVYINYFFDDLRTLNADGTIHDSVSVMDQDFVAVCWAWQSDNHDVAGKGAFIDDVIISVEDGLFDLQTEDMVYGYPTEAEDSLLYTNTPPTYLQPTYFRFDYLVNGIGRSPEFRINCLIDGEVFYSTMVAQVGTTDSVYSVVTPEPWIAPAGDHTVRWVLDADSTLTESNEENNVGDLGMFVPWTPAPKLDILTPEHDSTEVPLDIPFQIEITINDSNPEDSQFTMYLYLVEDTTGIRENPGMLDNLEASVFSFNARRERTGYTPDLRSREIGSLWFVVGLVNDGIFGNSRVSFAPGRIWIRPLDVAGTLSPPTEYYLAEAYPNPFNGEVKLEYALPVRGMVTLALYDLAGRQVALIENGVREVGVHTATWRPSGVGGGVYLAKLHAGGISFTRKLVYTP